MARDRESILRKLKKMAAKAASLQELGSEGEAQSFAEMMQKMAAEHQIDLSQLRTDDLEELDPIVRVVPPYEKYGVKIRQRHVDWLRELASAVAYGHFCRLLVVRGRSMVFFVGRKSQAEAAAEVYLKLVNVAEEIADKEYVKFFYAKRAENNVAGARGFRQSFLLGFCNRVGQRYYEYMAALRKYFANDAKALVVLNSSHSEVDNWIQKENVPEEKKSHEKKGPENWQGFLLGKKKGEEVEFSTAKRLE